MRRLGVFGGSFNPPHRAHVRVARRALEQAELDTVYWIPAAVPPHKQDERLAPDVHRLEMVRLITREYPGFQESNVELERQGVSYTVDTLEEFRRRYPADQLFLIVGQDSLRQMHTWHRPKHILKLIQCVLAYRRVHDGQSDTRIEHLADPESIHMLKGEPIDISSSRIRRAIAAGEYIESDVPRCIIRYIQENELYLSP